MVILGGLNMQKVIANELCFLWLYIGRLPQDLMRLGLLLCGSKHSEAQFSVAFFGLQSICDLRE